MTNKLEQNKEIIANIPQGATHHVIDNGTSYSFKIEDEQTFVWVGRWEYYINQRYSLPDLYEIRNVDDIRENIALQERVAELESHKLYMLEVAKSHDCDCITDLAVKCDGQERRIVELENLNKTLESLMKSGERRGVEKATEELSQTLAQKDAEIEDLKEKLKAQEECQERNDASNQDLLHEQDLELKKVRQENTKILGWIGQAMMRGLNEIDCGDELIKFQETNNLEQQAKGVEDFGNRTLFPSMGDGFSGDYCLGFEAALSKAVTVAKQLRQQAKALENGGKPQGGEK